MRYNKRLLVTGYVTVREASMGGSDKRDTARRERQRLIERLNAKEAELRKPRVERARLSEKGLELEIEIERQRNFSRRGFSQII